MTNSVKYNKLTSN